MSYLYNVNNQPVTGDISTATTVPTATGGVARSLRTRFADVIWAEDFGVQANGVSDDTAAWVNAFTAAQGTQTYVVIAPVGVSIVSTVDIPVGCTLRGAMPTSSYPFGTLTTLLGSVLKKTSGPNAAVRTFTTGTGNDNRGTSIVDMAIIGDTKVHNGITLAQGIPFYIRNCVITQCNVAIDGNTNGGDASCVIDGCTISVNNVGIWNVGDSRISNCYINGNSSHGIQLDSGNQDNIIINNKIEYNAGNGIIVNLCEDVIISNNIIDSSGINNISWTSCRNGVISGNALRNFVNNTMSGAHLFLQGNTDTVVSGNTTKMDSSEVTPVNSVNLGTGNTVVVMFGNAWKGHFGSTSITGTTTGTNGAILTASSGALTIPMVNSV